MSGEEGREKRTGEWSHGATIGILAVVLLAGAGVFFFLASSAPAKPAPGTAAAPTAAPGAAAQAASSLIHTTPGIASWYTNPALNFSFRLPDGFMAPDAKTNIKNARGVEVYNKSGDKLLILALPITGDTAGALTEAGVRANAPNQTITNVEPGVIATVVTGLSFDTNAKEWGGDGVAFWFKYNGYLYELTTYRKDAPLLAFIIQTWQFAPPMPPPIKR